VWVKQGPLVQAWEKAARGVHAARVELVGDAVAAVEDVELRLGFDRARRLLDEALDVLAECHSRMSALPFDPPEAG
jgi:hypothetical protein